MSFGDDTMHPDNVDLSMIRKIRYNAATRRSIHARFVKGRWDVGSVEDKRFLSLALCGEVGELANLIKKEWRGDVVDQDAIYKEMADAFNYLTHLADLYDKDLYDLSNEKYIEVEQRLVDQGK